MRRVKDKEFERLVALGIDVIPEKFLRLIENVAVVIENEPTPEQLRENDVPDGDTLLGLFEGPSMGDQGSGPWEFPAKITIFKNPTEDEAADMGVPVEDIVRDTVWHEIAHYFGMEEDEVHSAEERRREKKRR